MAPLGESEYPVYNMYRDHKSCQYDRECVLPNITTFAVAHEYDQTLPLVYYTELVTVNNNPDSSFMVVRSKPNTDFTEKIISSTLGIYQLSCKDGVEHDNLKQFDINKHGSGFTTVTATMNKNDVMVTGDEVITKKGNKRLKNKIYKYDCNGPVYDPSFPHFIDGFRPMEIYQVIAKVNKNNVETIIENGDRVYIKMPNGQQFFCIVPCNTGPDRKFQIGVLSDTKSIATHNAPLYYTKRHHQFYPTVQLHHNYVPIEPVRKKRRREQKIEDARKVYRKTKARLEHKVCAVMAKQEAGILEYHLDVGDGVKMFADIVYKHLNVLVECKIFSPYATRHAVSQATAGANMISQIEQCEYKKIIYLVVKSGKYTLASVRPFVEHTKKYVDGAANIMFRLITVSNDGVLISAEYF